ncbi:MAG: ATP-binding protein, partial [Bacteroidota bacterium]
AMNQGAYDFITKPIDVDDLGLVLDKSVRQVKQVEDTLEMAARLDETKREKELAEYSKQLQKEFFDNITHELRTPLTLLLGPLGKARTESSEDFVIRYLDQAQRNGQLLLDLINQLLDLAKIDARKMTLVAQPVEIVQRVRDLVAAFGILAEEKGLRFELETDLDALTIEADAPKISRILLNLLSNAFKFTPSGGEVRLNLTQEGDDLQIVVHDNGPGIPDALIAKIFERFYQVREDDSHSYRGTGIGLSLSKALAEMHGGSLTAASPDGAEFTLRVPVKSASGLSAQTTTPSTPATEYESAPAVTPATPIASTPEPAPTSAAEDAPLVLLVEDNPEMRTFTAGILRDHYRLLTAENGWQGLEIARAEIPDIVLSDWMMPEMDGIALLDHLKNGRDTSHIPVVLLTAKAQAEAQATGLKTGADAYLSKPFNPEALLAQLANLLTQRERLRERFKQDFLRPDKVEATSMEDQFIGDVKRLMEKHLGNEAFGVETMADEMAMSRRTLGRKLTALTGQSPVKFIRTYRLERGMDMLRNNAAPVWEVALKTGFGSSSYFTKCFKDHYGFSPREAAEQR